MRIRELLGRERVALPVAVLTPLLVTVAVVPFRDDFANTNAALILVLVIVAVAAVGSRVAGVLAATAAVWLDLLLTRPYGEFTISDRTDLETAALLLAVGVGVTQLAVWGRRQHALAQRDAGYLAGIRAAAEAVATGRLLR
jgi:K+-sensing histidine kinase KdpD